VWSCYAKVVVAVVGSVLAFGLLVVLLSDTVTMLYASPTSRAAPSKRVRRDNARKVTSVSFMVAKVCLNS
jgi:hypothetical protein